MTDAITGALLRAACVGISARLQAATEELNAIDAALGDGDLGSTLIAVAQSLDTEIGTLPDDVGEALARIAKVIGATSGSSFSGIMMTGLLRAARSTRGRTHIPLVELSAILRDSIAAMSASGGAKLGDKSVLDGIAAIAEAVRDARDGGDLPAVSDHAVQAALDAFRGRPCRIGRARLAAERSVGRDDPGMIALKRMIEGVRSQTPR